MFATLGAVCLLFLGDSISARPDSFPNLGLGPNVEAVNIARGGWTLVAWTSPPGAALLDGVECADGEGPDGVHVMIGGNDATALPWKPVPTSKVAFRYRLALLVYDLGQRWPDADVLISFTTRIYPTRGGDAKLAARRLMSEYDSTVYDVVNATRATVGIDARALNLPASMFPDGVHPSSVGQEVIAEALRHRVWRWRLRRFWTRQRNFFGTVQGWISVGGRRGSSSLRRSPG